ncbi:S26 family signal peptidase [Dactylosporangium sp. CS-033363]|uniref:S26 family signal peptidase n=1 Tax=Dactylosporangium sp. CS-033363 TaxID=3239935 RepID=UPI003D8D2786
MIAGLAAGAVAVAGLVWLRRAFLVVTVTGRSMTPTFEPGDRVLARRGRARTGDVVIVGPARGVRGEEQQPGPVRGAGGDGQPGERGRGEPLRLVIKRLAASPGEPVPRDRVPALADVPEATVPAGKMVLLGDAAESSDSRQLGYFDADRIVGRAVRRLARR